VRRQRVGKVQRGRDDDARLWIVGEDGKCVSAIRQGQARKLRAVERSSAVKLCLRDVSALKRSGLERLRREQDVAETTDSEVVAVAARDRNGMAALNDGVALILSKLMASRLVLRAYSERRSDAACEDQEPDERLVPEATELPPNPSLAACVKHSFAFRKPLNLLLGEWVGHLSNSSRFSTTFSVPSPANHQPVSG
jgi:hypothetical protein